LGDVCVLDDACGLGRLRVALGAITSEVDGTCAASVWWCMIPGDDDAFADALAGTRPPGPPLVDRVTEPADEGKYNEHCSVYDRCSITSKSDRTIVL
jgi:hypothetical protein